ncbi:MAG TPA: carbohydrate ABC transporter permease [Firmicutes bacterium]|jgi:multiple sugar transport system permease protein|nr:carbohydrate ABC transporter permease [Bacillota bacterium]
MPRFTKKSSGLLTSLDFKSTGNKVLYWGIFLLMAIITIICLFPPVWLFASSVKDLQELYSMSPTILPKTWELHKIIDVWNQLHFFTYYLNSLQLAAGDIVFSLVFNSLFGFVLSQLKPKGTSFLMVLLLWTLLLPNTVNIVPVYMNIINFPFLHLNFSNTFFPMWFMSGANAFFTLIFKSFFDGIPRSFTEAAMLDGCSPVKIFFKIFLPLSKPVMFVITILTLTQSWSNFFWPYMVLTNQDLYTVMIRIFTMIPSGNSGNGLAVDWQMLAIVYSMIPPIVVFLFLQKYIMQGGLTLGGIKG